MVTLFKRGKVWWAYSTFDGVRKRWSLKTASRSVAEDLRRQVERDILGGGRLLATRWTGFYAEFQSFARTSVQPSTLKGYCGVLDPFDRFLAARGFDKLTDITPSVISQFNAWRRDHYNTFKAPAKTEGGVKFDLRVLHRVFAYAVDSGHIIKNPVIIKSRNSSGGHTMPFSREDISAMLSDRKLQAKVSLRAIVMTFLHTGLRIGDLASLPKSAIHGDTLILETRKRRKTITLPLHPELKAVLSEQMAATPGPFIFGLQKKNVDKRLRTLWKRCGVSGGHAHRFRDTFIVALLAKGASLYDAAKLIGISMQTAERHYSPYVEELKQRGAKLVCSLDFSVNVAAVYHTTGPSSSLGPLSGHNGESKQRPSVRLKAVNR